MYGLKAVPFTDLDEEIVIRVEVVVDILFAHHVDARTKTIDNAVHLADGHGNSMLDGVNSGRQTVERALDHAIHSRSLGLSPVGYVFHEAAYLIRLGAKGGAYGGQVVGDGSKLGRDVLDYVARGNDCGQGVQTNVVGQPHKLFLGFARANEHGNREASLHQDADRGHGNEDEQ
jgi:hypothetical protein